MIKFDPRWEQMTNRITEIESLNAELVELVNIVLERHDAFVADEPLPDDSQEWVDRARKAVGERDD